MDILKVVTRSPLAFPLACIATLAMVFISEGSYWQAVSSMDAIARMQTARVGLVGVAQSILDAETGQRGYLLTNRKEYLQPYETAVKRIDESFRVLDGYYGDQPASRAVLGRLRELTDTRLSELALTIRMHEQGRDGAARDLVLSDIGKEKMEAIRVLGAELLAHETLKVAAGRRDMSQTLMLNRVGVAALSAVSLLALFLFLRQSAAVDRHELAMKRRMEGERDRLEREVAQRTAQLTELAQHLQTAREDERTRLARDLHDELGALLTSAKLDAARIKSRLGATAPEAQERLGHLVDMLNAGIALKRRIIEDLRPSALSNLGLVATLDILTREFAERSGVAVHCNFEPIELNPAAELVVYRLVQEAITNLSKYAQASNLWVDLAIRGGQVEISVRDDGVGFDPSLPRTSSHGLMGMRFRIEAVGGTLAVASAPGQGTQILARLPTSTLRAAEQPADA